MLEVITGGAVLFLTICVWFLSQTNVKLQRRVIALEDGLKRLSATAKREKES